MGLLSKTRVGVLRGGPSSEYEVSLLSGGTVLKHLPEKYQPVDIFISKDGTWHWQGMEHDPREVLHKVDVLFNALHGEYGEDGKVQNMLEAFGVPFTGSKSFPSALAMNKALAKDFLKQFPIKTPTHRIITVSDAEAAGLHELFRAVPHPCIVKPVSLGSSVGMSLVIGFSDFEPALAEGFRWSDQLLIEEYIDGREATCGVIDDFRGVRHYALLPVEIIPPEGSAFFDYNAKYGGQSREICPGNFSREESNTLQQLAIIIHRELGLRHYSRSDFIVSPTRGIYFLEANTLPGLTQESLLPKALDAVGCKMSHFLEHVIELALKK